ncbi:MAG TPA: tetratricopeptide repeat protein [Gemmatimonadaceae bacterium]|nr:tetratricopeptide repeat protein [Gemmatimonadaceae bacterium]
MTSPLSQSDTTESMMDWFQLHSREVTWGSVAVIALVAGGWFYNRSQELKATRAETAYFAAQRSVVSGNLPLAESDLKKMIARYDGTPAATEGKLALAQVLYEQKKYQAGIDVLKGGSKAGDYTSSVHAVMAGGYEQLKKFKEAGAEYQEAAKAARFDPDRQRYEALAANAYLAGGDSAKAKEIWTALGADSKGTVAGEARVRLGELVAVPEPRN